MKICRVEEMRQMDQRAISEYGMPQAILMENAGQAVYFTILNNFGIKDKNFVFFCGAGNNGGDGLVVARKIHSNGGQVQIFLLSSPVKFKGSARLNYQLAKKLKLPLKHIKDVKAALIALQKADAVVDAIFGTGLDREVGGMYRRIIEAVNRSGKTVFSVDIPSGINGNNGHIMGVAVQADHTVTFGLPKIGNLLYPGYANAGRLSVTHISFPPALYEDEQLKIALNQPAPIPPRPADGHKGRFGKALFIAGAANYLGAPYFSALSFLKAGGGLSFLAAPKTITSFIATQGREIIFSPQRATAEGSLALSNKDDLLEFSQETDFVVMGPGLSLNEETRFLVRELTAEIAKPLLIDGDGLSAVAEDMECLKGRQGLTVLTPHLAEMSRLTGKTIGEIRSDGIQILQETAAQLQAIIVLKGAHSLIGLPDGSVFINLSGNAGMATAGSGDVLTGTIAAMFAQKLPLDEAVKAGVFLHGYAADLAVPEIGEDGLIAGDLLRFLPKAVKTFRQLRDEILDAQQYGVRII